MRKLTIQSIDSKSRAAYKIFVYLDEEKIGIINAKTSVTFNINDNEHSLYCVVYVTVIGGDDVPIYSNGLIIPSSNSGEWLPATIDYVINVTLIQTSMGEQLKSVYKSMARSFFVGSKKATDEMVNGKMKLILEQDMNNKTEVQQKQHINTVFINCNRARMSISKQLQNDPYAPLDFSAFERLTNEERNHNFMTQIMLPKMLGAAYATAGEEYYNGKMSIRFMHEFLNQFSYFEELKPSIRQSLKHFEYIAVNHNDINSVFSENVVHELEELEMTECDIPDYSFPLHREMKETILKKMPDEMKEDEMYSIAKKVFDYIVRASEDVSFFDNMKKSAVYITLLERDVPEVIANAYSSTQLANQQVFSPIVIEKGEYISGKTVDMLIADAIHFSKVNTMSNIDNDLKIFLEKLCPAYNVEEKQYTILQRVFAWLKAYKQEAMVLETMVKNSIPRTNEQDQRLAFLNSQSHMTSSIETTVGLSVSNRSQFDLSNGDSNKMCYDYRFMTMNDSELKTYFNSLSMENQSLYIPVVVDEWNKTIDAPDIVWDENKVQAYISSMLNLNFGERYIAKVIESGVDSDGWEEYTPSILISDVSPKGYPWVSFVITGEQMMLNQITLSIYTLYRPENDTLGDNIYERNNILFNKIQLLKRKQNPRLNNTIQIINNVLIKELENWINSVKHNNIYN